MDTATLLPVLVAKVCEDAPTDVGGSIWLSAKAADTGSCAKHCCTKRKKLEGKVAVITGGAQGIGEETAKVFVRNGAWVVIADVEEEKGRKVAEDLGGAATYVRCDVSVEADVERAVKVAVALHGGVDVMFNNAGVLGEQQEKSIMDLDGDEMDMVMRVNVKGVALGMKMAAREMVGRGKGGCIISTASVAGVMGGLGPHSYTASKHAIVGLTKNAACELGRYGIRVNCISPFGVATDMLVRAWNPNPEPSDVEKTEEMVRGLANLKGPTLRATDIAHAALYLASDDAAYVSGHNLVVDGGVTSVYNCIGL